MTFRTKLETLSAIQGHDAFVELILAYSNPAFGAMSKREFDILLFMKLQELGVIPQEPEIYELVRDLKITRSKARNLLYEAKLRTSTDAKLEEELKALLKRPVFMKEGDKIALEIGNPFLTDHLRNQLKKLGHISDGSFSPELIKLSTDAYLALFTHCLPEAGINTATKILVALKLTEDTSAKGVLKAVVKKIGSQVADDAGRQLISALFDGIFKNDEKSITKLASELEE